MVLHDLIDKFYAVVALVDNATELSRAEGRREPVHHMIEMIDRANRPEKYRPVVMRT